MSASASELFTKLEQLLAKFESQPIRAYTEPWSDWPGGVTGGQDFPCIYCLYSEQDPSSLLYVGETVNLGVRLSEHDNDRRHTHTNWKYVRYLADQWFADLRQRKLFESFCICFLNPLENVR